MKYTIEGFNQEYAISLQKKIIENDKEKIIKLDCIDLVILRWIVDFEPNMSKKIIDSETYFWVNYQSLLEALPILDMKKRMLFYRLEKMCDLNILKHKNIKENGNYSYYSFDKNYQNLVQKNANDMQNIAEPFAENCLTLMQNIAEQNNSSIKETHLLNNSITPYSPPKGENEISNTELENICSKVVYRLNELTGSNFKSDTESTKKLIKALLSDYSEADILMVVEKMYSKWGEPKKGEKDMSEYLRPSTLFRKSNFDNYYGMKIENATSSDPFTEYLMDFKEKKYE